MVVRDAMNGTLETVGWGHARLFSIIPLPGLAMHRHSCVAADIL